MLEQLNIGVNEHRYGHGCLLKCMTSPQIDLSAAFFGGNHRRSNPPIRELPHSTPTPLPPHEIVTSFIKQAGAAALDLTWRLIVSPQQSWVWCSLWPWLSRPTNPILNPRPTDPGSPTKPSTRKHTRTKPMKHHATTSSPSPNTEWRNSTS